MATKYPRKAGIYKLTCIPNGKIYIGKAVNINKRMARHKNCMTGKSKDQGILPKAIKKYGWDSFNVEIIEIYEIFDKKNDNDRLLEREAFYIDHFNALDLSIGYNMCRYSNDNTGKPCSEETRRKISEGNMGKKHTSESKERIRLAQLGKKRSPETIEKMRIISSGRIPSKETREKMRLARLGHVYTEEVRRKISISTSRTKKSLGFKHSEETKQKMRLARLGKKRSPETMEKIKQTRIRNRKELTKSDE
jgi:group I intron endonuclease